MWGGMGATKNENIKYIKSTTPKNKAALYASKLIKTNVDQCNNNQLLEDYKIILNNGCFYIPNMFEKSNDRTIYDKLMSEIKKYECKLTIWSKHFKYENPDFLPTLNEIVNKMANYFNVTICHTRLNYYPDNHSWKPFHKDSHKMVDGIQENFTMGASFGATRELELKHEETGKTFKFPQNNGDCFAFTSEVNNVFLHGVPKVHTNILPRFSIIAWGFKKNVKYNMSKRNDRFIYILEKYIKNDTQKILTYITPHEGDFIFNNCRKFNYINIMCETLEQEELVTQSKCKNVRVYNSNMNDNLNKLTHDIIYISIGNDSKLDTNGRMYFGDQELVDIVNNYGNIIIIYVLNNYNLHAFVEKSKYGEIDVYGQGDKSEGFYIVVKKNKYVLL